MDNPPQPPPEAQLILQRSKEQGLSLREAARRAGISDRWFNDLMKGHLAGARSAARAVAKAETLAKMACGVGVTAGELESLAATAYRDSPADQRRLTEAAEMARTMERGTADMQTRAAAARHLRVTPGAADEAADALIEIYNATSAERAMLLATLRALRAQAASGQSAQTA